MTNEFDVFRIEADGGVLWRGMAATPEEAKAFVQELCVNSPGPYVILNLRTGSKLMIKGDGRHIEPRADQSPYGFAAQEG